jgi:hypothetical protein
VTVKTHALLVSLHTHAAEVQAAHRLVMLPWPAAPPCL